MMRFIAKICCVLFVPLGLSNAQTAINAASEEDAAVYRAVFDKLYTPKREHPGMIVIADSLYPRSAGVAYKGRMLVAHVSQIDQQTVDDFERATGGYGTPPSAIAYQIPVTVLKAGELEALEKLGRNAAPNVNDRGENTFWLGFVKRFPDAWGLTVLSGIGYNHRNDEAMTFVRHQCGPCESAETLFLRKENGAWRVVERIPTSYQDAIGISNLRYVGPDARLFAQKRRIEDSIRLAMRDSLERDRAPRRISGRVVDKRTGLPVRYAQIFLGNAQSYPRHWGRFVADSLGNFTIPNPPVGGNHLEIECAGDKYQPARTLDMRAMYMAPGAVAFVDIFPVNIAPCWRNRRVRRLSLGWFESKEARNSPVPSDDEANVLAVVLDRLRAQAPVLRLGWAYNRTSDRCKWDEKCGEVAIPALVDGGTIDSSLVGDFEKKASKAIDINPRFFQSNKLEVVSPEVITYYAEESLLDSYLSGDPDFAQTAFWSVFHKLNGRNAAILAVTRPAFSRDGTQALIEVRADSTPEHWQRLSTMMLLTKTGQSWKVAIPDIGNLKRSGRWSADRCRPTIIERETVTRTQVADLLGDFLVTMVPAVGRNDTRSTRMRISRKPKDPIVFLNQKDGTSRAFPFPVPKGLSHAPPVFEILDDNGAVNDNASLDFFLAGDGQEIQRRSSVLRLDGYSQSLVIRELDESGFSGTYSAGVYGPGEFGIFCARRLTTVPGVTDPE